MNKEEITTIEIELLELLRTRVIDPEIELNIVDLGLIYELNCNGKNEVEIVMTFSTPSCPLAETIKMDITETIRRKYPNFKTHIQVVFTPKWSTANISEEGRKILGL